MKKYCFLLFFALSIAAAGAQEYESPFRFKIYPPEEAGALFPLISTFERMENGLNCDEASVALLLERGLNSNGLMGLYTQAFFRETQNPEIRNSVIQYLSDFDDRELADSIINRYNAVEEAVGHGSRQTVRFVNDEMGLYDENLLFSQAQPINIFNGRLNVVIPVSDWLPMPQVNPASGETRHESFGLSTGGATTACTIIIKKEHITSVPAIGSIHNPDSHLFEFTDEGLFVRNGADLTVLKIHASEESLFVFNIRLYDFQEKAVYDIGYHYNISEANLNYRIYERLKKQMLYTSFLSFLR